MDFLALGLDEGFGFRAGQVEGSGVQLIEQVLDTIGDAPSVVAQPAPCEVTPVD